MALHLSCETLLVLDGSHKVKEPRLGPDKDTSFLGAGEEPRLVGLSGLCQALEPAESSRVSS